MLACTGAGLNLRCDQITISTEVNVHLQQLCGQIYTSMEADYILLCSFTFVLLLSV